MRPLEGKAALVTGGSRGIGAAIARRLAADGAKVALTYAHAEEEARRVVEAIDLAGGHGLAIRADSANAGDLFFAVENAVRSLGGLDILVNSAGTLVVAPLDEFRLEDLDRMWAVNVRAVFVAIQAAAPHLREGGRIVTIGSTNADRMPFPGGGPYAMTKAAVAGLTRGLARDLGSRGITVNTVQPGPVNTDLNPQDGPSAAALHGLMALPRHGTPEEIASFVAYVVSPEAAFITGASLTIDGGFAA